MRTIYIRRLDGEVETCTGHTYVTFLANGMVQVDTPFQGYLIDKSNIEIISDDVKELLDNWT